MVFPAECTGSRLSQSLATRVGDAIRESAVAIAAEDGEEVERKFAGDVKQFASDDEMLARLLLFCCMTRERSSICWR